MRDMLCLHLNHSCLERSSDTWDSHAALTQSMHSLISASLLHPHRIGFGGRETPNRQRLDRQKYSPKPLLGLVLQSLIPRLIWHPLHCLQPTQSAVSCLTSGILSRTASSPMTQGTESRWTLCSHILQLAALHCCLNAECRSQGGEAL